MGTAHKILDSRSLDTLLVHLREICCLVFKKQVLIDTQQFACSKTLGKTCMIHYNISRATVSRSKANYFVIKKIFAILTPSFLFDNGTEFTFSKQRNSSIYIPGSICTLSLVNRV